MLGEIGLTKNTLKKEQLLSAAKFVMVGFVLQFDEFVARLKLPG